MKKLRVFFVLFLVFILSGCTIDISKNKNKDIEKDDEEEITDLEEVESVGVSSSIDSPLSIGEYGLASKYNVYLGKYKDVDVKLSKIYEDSEEIVTKYNLSNPNKMINKQKGFKYVVLEYEVTFFDFKTESFGDNVRLDIEVVDSNNNNFVVDKVKQVIEVHILKEDLGIVDGGIGTVKVAFAIPSYVDNYLIKFGTYDHTIAYYKV